MRCSLRHMFGALAVTACVGGAASAQEIDLKLAWLSADSPTDPYAITAHAFKDAIEAAMPGRVSVALFPNRQLGEEKEVLEAIQFGTIDMGVITNAVVATVEPTYQLVDLPFLFGSAAQAHEVLDGPVGQELAANLETRGAVSLGAAEGGFRNMVNNVRPIAQPGDVTDVKFRTMQNPVFIDMFKALGGNPAPMAWGDVFTAVQQGMVDGLEIPASVVDANKFYEIAKYLSMTRHTYSAIHLLMSKSTFDGLPDDVKAAVVEAGKAAIRKEREIVAANEAAVLERLRAAGMEINELDDVAPFRDAVQGVYGNFEGAIGADLLARTKEAVSAN